MFRASSLFEKTEGAYYEPNRISRIDAPPVCSGWICRWKHTAYAGQALRGTHAALVRDKSAQHQTGDEHVVCTPEADQRRVAQRRIRGGRAPRRPTRYPAAWLALRYL